MKKIHLIWQIPMILIGTVLILIGVHLINENNEFMVRDKSTTGEVIDIKSNNEFYEYYVDGEKYVYEQFRMRRTLITIGDKGTIYYDSTNPERAATELNSGFGPAVVVVGSMLAILGLSLFLANIDLYPLIVDLGLGIALINFGFLIPITLRIYKLMIFTGIFGIIGIRIAAKSLINAFDPKKGYKPSPEDISRMYEEQGYEYNSKNPIVNLMSILVGRHHKSSELSETAADIEEEILDKYKDSKDGGKALLNLFRTLPDIIICFSIPTTILFIGLKDQNDVRRFMVTIAIILYIVMFFICLYRFLNRQFNLGKTKAAIVFKVLGRIIPILIFCLVFIILGVTSVLNYIDDKDFAANCVETKGQVVNVTKEYDYDDEKYYYLTEFTYFVNDTNYTGKYYYSKALKVGDEVTVYYLEESPSESKLSTVVYPPSGAFACIVALLMGAYAFYSVFKQLRDYKERQAMFEDPFEE